ncbi:SURF1 family protein [Rothia terrae]|uniref:SURF1 family cytochrome oxidase biogenesis protein n=1 Tax=Rothia terrae TaxID=396015 RepID=UPI0031D70879
MLKQALKPRWIGLLLVALALVSGFVMLSMWQLNSSTLGRVNADPAKDRVRPYTEVLKANEPLIQTQVDTVVEAEGTYVQGSSYLIENRLENGAHGYWIVSEFVPKDAQKVSIDGKQTQRAIAVARAWSRTTEIPQEPQGTVKIAGRVVSNEPAVASQSRHDEDAANPRTLASTSTAQLTNLWERPLYSSILTVAAEVPASQSLPVTAEKTIDESSTIIGQNQDLTPVRVAQVEDHDINWLNIFYSLEWLVFAGFALYLWWRMLKDSLDKESDPAQYFEYTGEYFIDEETGRAYYFDPADQQYYFFDTVPDMPSSTTTSRPTAQ